MKSEDSLDTLIKEAGGIDDFTPPPFLIDDERVYAQFSDVLKIDDHVFWLKPVLFFETSMIAPTRLVYS